MNEFGFEQGPIRPPSEAMSLLVRVSRNCPWNRCAFCPVYKGAKFSRRSVAEIHADLDALKSFHGDAPRTVFLQDADPLITRPDDMVAVLSGIRERFPRVRRITTYARSKTLSRRSLEDLVRIREAGLDRVHVGMESGCDDVLALVRKGVTGAEHARAGKLARQAGLSLCYYVMPGLGGRALTDRHADDTAAVVAEVQPDHVRLRTTVAVPGTPLHEMQEAGEWEPLGDTATVAEIRRFLSGLDGVTTRIESDHVLNLLMELRGDLPDEHERLLRICDEFLGLEREEQLLFILGRRTGRLATLRQLDRPGVRRELRAVLEQVRRAGRDPEEVVEELKRRFV